MLAKSIREYLDGEHVPYTTISHQPSYTAQGIAAETHISGKDLAKTVMIKLDGKMVMAVLPAAYHVNFHLLKEATGATNIELAREDEFMDLFPDLENHIFRSGDFYNGHFLPKTFPITRLKT